MEYAITAIVLLIASYVITALITPKPKDATPSTLKDFDVPTIDEGTPQCVVFGDCWSGDWTVLWYGDFDVQPIGGGGKK